MRRRRSGCAQGWKPSKDDLADKSALPLARQRGRFEALELPHHMPWPGSAVPAGACACPRRPSRTRESYRSRATPATMAEVRHVEHVGEEGDPVEQDEIRHRAVESPIDGVAQAPPMSRPSAMAMTPTFVPASHTRQDDRGDDGQRDERPPARRLVLLEEPVGDAPVPDEREVEERRHPDRRRARRSARRSACRPCSPGRRASVSSAREKPATLRFMRPLDIFAGQGKGRADGMETASDQTLVGARPWMAGRLR